MSEDCIFCRIATGDIPIKEVYSDEDIVAFHDINPQAPVHLLIIPRKHITSLAHVSQTDTMLIGHIIDVANELARENSIADSGYRFLTNIGQSAGQSVDHLHFHVLGGRDMTWPPG